MRKLLLICPAAFLAYMLLLPTNRVNGQQFSYGKSAKFERYEALFNYEVKEVEEFIERFNDDSDSYFRKVCKEKKIEFTFSRQQMIYSLLNLENKKIQSDTSLLNDFINKSTAVAKPTFLNFTDNNWFAEANAIVLCKEKLYSVPVILHVQSKKNDWAKWMIASCGNLKPVVDKSNAKPDDYLLNQVPTYIPTSSCATNFVDLNYVFNSKEVDSNFFDNAYINCPQGKKFLSQIKSSQIQFLYVKDIVYHFYNVDGYIFDVEQFERESWNSGWLINKCWKATQAEKAKSINSLLRNNYAYE